MVRTRLSKMASQRMARICVEVVMFVVGFDAVVLDVVPLSNSKSQS